MQAICNPWNSFPKEDFLKKYTLNLISKHYFGRIHKFKQQVQSICNPWNSRPEEDFLKRTHFEFNFKAFFFKEFISLSSRCKQFATLGIRVRTKIFLKKYTLNLISNHYFERIHKFKQQVQAIYNPWNSYPEEDFLKKQHFEFNFKGIFLKNS